MSQEFVRLGKKDAARFGKRTVTAMTGPPAKPVAAFQVKIEGDEIQI